jgi:multidrug transporter EmrE-like cation transporter
MVPFVLLYTTASTNFSWYIILLFIAFPITHYGIALANQTGDYLEDKAEGLASPAVKWGLNNTLRLAKSMTLIGLFLELFAIFGIIWYAPWVARMDAALGLAIPAKYLLMVMIGVVMSMAYSVPLRGLFSLHNISNKKSSLKSRMTQIKTRMNYPIWQASGIWGLVITSIIILTGTLSFGA